ncbi:MAG TPA: IPT/TIG domain-containing protein [Casimicrobiaceae bacterium]|nr:IPT/TIG domain-containing protein [Casimicrobiaceae bacterium]
MSTATAAPAITSISPTSGPVGTLVTINGSGFTGATSVRFGGSVAAVFTVVSDTRITTTVPTGASSGGITVTTPGGSATSGRFRVSKH